MRVVPQMPPKFRDLAPPLQKRQNICILDRLLILKIKFLINNVPVPRTESYTCLGVELDERLTWEKHIDKICAKVGAGIGVMRRMRPFVPLETHNALVQSYFDYCSPLWDNCGGGLKNKLQRLQNRAARAITGSTFDIRSDDVRSTLGWES